jgi:hypothetical protein
MTETTLLNLKFPKDFFKDYAKGQECLIRIAAVCLAEPCAPDTTVLCHFTLAGYKAMGSRKASLPDLCGAWGCRTCHDICDGRIAVRSELATKKDIKLWHAEAVMRTLDALVKAGVLPNPC